MPPKQKDDVSPGVQRVASKHRRQLSCVKCTKKTLLLHADPVCWAGWTPSKGARCFVITQNVTNGVVTVGCTDIHH